MHLLEDEERPICAKIGCSEETIELPSPETASSMESEMVAVKSYDAGDEKVEKRPGSLVKHVISHGASGGDFDYHDDLEDLEDPSPEQRRALVERELRSLTEKHVETVLASFYSKAKTLLLFSDRWSLGLAARTVTALCTIWLQQFALHGVDASLFFVWRFSQRIHDDEVQNTAFPGGVQYPANYQFMNSYDTSNANSFGVPSSTWLTLLFCTFAIVLEMHDVVEEQRVLYLLVRRGPAWPNDTRAMVDAGSRWAAAWLLHGARFCLILKFLAISVELLGTSDGPLELVLNSLALGFVLEFDQAASLVLTADGPLKHSVFGRLTVSRYRRGPGRDKSILRTPLEAAFRAILTNANKKGRGLIAIYNAVERMKPIVITFVVFHLAFRLQRFTSRGRFVTVDDDFVSHQETLTRIFNTNLDALGCFLLISNHLAHAVTLPNDAAQDAKHVARRFVVFALEFTLMVLILYQLIFVYMDNLIIRNEAAVGGFPHLVDLLSPFPSSRRGERFKEGDDHDN